MCLYITTTHYQSIHLVAVHLNQIYIDLIIDCLGKLYIWPT